MAKKKPKASDPTTLMSDAEARQTAEEDIKHRFSHSFPPTSFVGKGIMTFNIRLRRWYAIRDCFLSSLANANEISAKYNRIRISDSTRTIYNAWSYENNLELIFGTRSTDFANIDELATYVKMMRQIIREVTFGFATSVYFCTVSDSNQQPEYLPVIVAPSSIGTHATWEVRSPAHACPATEYETRRILKITLNDFLDVCKCLFADRILSKPEADQLAQAVLIIDYRANSLSSLSTCVYRYFVDTAWEYMRANQLAPIPPMPAENYSETALDAASDLILNWRGTIASMTLTKAADLKNNDSDISKLLERIQAANGPTSAEIIAIAANINQTVDQRMRAIVRIDRTAIDWLSKRWGVLLDCTDRAVRDTGFWKIDRPAALKARATVDE